MARYRRQVLMSLVHQLSYRSLGEVSNIGVTEAGWLAEVQRRRHHPTRVSRSLDTSTPLSLLRRGYSGTSTSTTIATTPGCRRRHLASVRHPSLSPSSAPSFRLSPSWETRTSLSRSIFILRRSTSRHAVLVHPSRRVRGFARTQSVPSNFLSDAFSIFHAVCRISAKREYSSKRKERRC